MYPGFTHSQFYMPWHWHEEVSFPSWWSSIENLTIWVFAVELPRELASLKTLGWPIDFCISLLMRCPNLVEFYALHAKWDLHKRVSPLFKTGNISHWRMRPWGSAIHCIIISNSLLFARSLDVAPLAKRIIGSSQVEIRQRMK